MFKKTNDIISIYYTRGKDWFELGKRVLYAKIVKAKSYDSPYDKMYGKFVGFYVRVGGKYRKVHNVYGNRPYIK